MKIAICGSLDFAHEMKKAADELKMRGIESSLPPTAVKILNGELSVGDIQKEKESGIFQERTIKSDLIRHFWGRLEDANAILVVNHDKKGVKNYVGGNSFLEMGFAHVSKKPIFLLNDIPNMLYTDEIKAMQPLALKGDFSRLV